MSETDLEVPGSQTIPPRARWSWGDLGGFLERFGLVGILVLMALAFSIALPETFPTVANFRIILTSQSVLAVAALALLMPLVAGRFDISVGSNVCLSAVLIAGSMSRHDLPLLVAILIGVCASAGVGLLNGVMVAYLGINSLIGTLGTSTVLTGLILLYTDGIPVSTNLSEHLTGLSTQRLVGVPVLFLIALALAVVVWFVVVRTVFGRYLTAVGSNEAAAALSGLPVRPAVAGSFVASGLICGAAGALQIASQGNANPQIGGIAFMLPALAAVFLGATTLIPGSYNVAGTLLALLFVGTAISGLTLQGVQPWVIDAFNGTAVIVAVGMAAYFRRRRTGQASVGG